jgi:hypothetical protein
MELNFEAGKIYHIAIGTARHQSEALILIKEWNKRRQRARVVAASSPAPLNLILPFDIKSYKLVEIIDLPLYAGWPYVSPLFTELIGGGL